jgi:molybdopterin adenylyltransferase
MENLTTIKIGIVSTSDRASTGVYVDEGLPALRDWLTRAVRNPIAYFERLIPDEQTVIEHTLIELSDAAHCDLILTTGGTGPALRDVTPDATRAVIQREMQGFGEQMRQISLHFVPTAILSRQTAGVRDQTLIVNLPGRPAAIAQTLEGLRDSEGTIVVHGIFASIPYCIELIGGASIQTDEAIIKVFRPKSK